MKTPGLFADGNGLYLQVTAAGTKSWIFRFSLSGRRRDMGLGPTSLLSLADAREKAIEAKRLVAAGVDPIDARKVEKSTPAAAPEAVPVTFRAFAEEYVHSKSPGWRNEKHAAQ